MLHCYSFIIKKLTKFRQLRWLLPQPPVTVIIIAGEVMGEKISGAWPTRPQMQTTGPCGMAQLFASGGVFPQKLNPRTAIDRSTVRFVRYYIYC